MSKFHLCILAFLVAMVPNGSAQDAALRPPPYRGAVTMVPGVFVTPVPGAPFTAVVQTESMQIMPDGTTAARKSTATIARDSRGRIYNERRQLLPASTSGDSPMLASHIFDPETRVSTVLNPFSRLARQQNVPRAETAPQSTNSREAQEDLGTQMMENEVVRGTRQSRTVPASVAGTAKDLVVSDEYWYSESLHINMLTKHSDPRTGVQVLAIRQVNRSEPDPLLFQVPAAYKVVDENPAN